MVTLDEVKDALGIDDTLDDTQLTSILASVNDMVESAVGDLAEGTKSMQVRHNVVDKNTIALNIINPTAILSVDGVDYSSKVKGTDYFIYEDGSVKIPDLWDDITNDFGVFILTFTAGYNTTPVSLINTVASYVGYLFSQDNGKDIVSEKMGPRGVSYMENTSEDGVSPEYKAFRRGLKKYIPLCIRIY